MRFYLKLSLIILFCVFTIFCCGPGGILTQSLNREAINVIIPKKSNTFKTSEILSKKNIIDHPYFFFIASLINKFKGQGFKYGEYKVEPHTNLWSIIKLLCSGKTVIHYFTIPEGITISEICQRLQDESLLTGEIQNRPPEGMVFPETYDFKYGDNRQDILDRMRYAMEKILKQLWIHRDSQSIISSPQDALILASIVEKETGVIEEMPLVASVFLNRLKIGMKLQSDPTVIYGITLGNYCLSRSLSTQDLKTPTDYNTYTINGLPPTPIACPGKQALSAVLFPIKTKYLYFVANGTGSHNFSNAYNTHLQNVQKWRKIKEVQNNGQ